MASPIPLFTPITQRSVTFRNRLGVSPMCMYSCAEGYASDFHLVHLGSRALGGHGMVMAEATSVAPEGRITGNDLGLWEDGHIAPLRRVTDFLRQHVTVPAIQLAHAGWKAGSKRPWTGDHPPAHPGGWTPVGVSPIAFTDKQPVPTEIADPAVIVRQFTAAAERSLKAGFDLLELHAAHGYLLHSFHSPISNRRSDGYGGGFDGRTRLTREIVASVRQVWPQDKPLWIRFSCTDYVEGGWDLDQSVQLARLLKGMGVDCIDCSSGGIRAAVPIRVGPGYQVPFAERIRREAGIATAAVGQITTAAEAAAIVAEGRADFVLIARASLRDPQFPLHAAAELGQPLPLPGQYERGF